MELKRVVVTGLGAITPIGNSVPEFWENLVNGVSGAGPITHFDASLFKTQFACEVKGFDATKYIDRKEARKMDLYTQYAIAVAKEAVGDSGLDVENEDLNRIGVIFGAGIGGIRTFEEEAGNYALTGKENGPKFNPFFIPKMIRTLLPDKFPSCMVSMVPTTQLVLHVPLPQMPLPMRLTSSVWVRQMLSCPVVRKLPSPLAV